MKKILLGLVLLLVVALAAVYLFIPGRIKMKASISINAALPGVNRVLANDSNWNKWWPGTTSFTYKEQVYTIRGRILNAFDIVIHNNQDSLYGRIDLVIAKVDTTTIVWNAEQVSSTNPFKRFAEYRLAASTKKNMQAILNSMKAYLEKTENIYGFNINETKVIDSVLISTRRSFDHQPAVQDVDAMIQSLKKYIAQNRSLEKNLPMLNVHQVDSSHYEVMTAIPVDRQLPSTSEFVSKFLLKGGNILEAQIQGGPHTIENALKEFENYRSDYNYASPAIPYQLLVTDRMKEQDTAKWVTKLYYPVL